MQYALQTLAIGDRHSKPHVLSAQGCLMFLSIPLHVGNELPGYIPTYYLVRAGGLLIT